MEVGRRRVKLVILLLVINCPPWSRKFTGESKEQILVLRFIGKLGPTMLGLLF